MSAALLTPQISSALADVRQQVDNSLEASEVAGSTVERWEHTVRRYAEAYEIAPPLQALVDAAQDVAVVREQRERPQSLNQKQRLTRVVAQLSILIASYSRELGDYRASRNWSHTARLAAEDVGDRTLRAWVMARDSMAPLYEGNFAGAIELAQGAEILAGAGPSPAAVLAPVVRARALAQVGRADEARKTIEHAHTAFDRLGHDGQRDLLFGYTERQLCFHSAQVWTYTQDFDDAQHAHERATVLYAPTEYLDRALMGLDMALRLVATGNADSAAEHAASVITGLESGQRSSMIEGRARAVLRALPAKARHTNAVETYRDALVGIQSASGRNERN
jgi:tetratricopeptide (TPR) repeat protein